MSLMLRPAGDFGSSDVVDILNGIAGTWSTAVLSVARSELAATSLPNVGVAIFAGGCTSCYVYIWRRYMLSIYVVAGCIDLWWKCMLELNLFVF